MIRPVTMYPAISSTMCYSIKGICHKKDCAIERPGTSQHQGKREWHTYCCFENDAVSVKTSTAQKRLK